MFKADTFNQSNFVKLKSLLLLKQNADIFLS